MGWNEVKLLAKLYYHKCIVRGVVVLMCTYSAQFNDCFVQHLVIMYVSNIKRVKSLHYVKFIWKSNVVTYSWYLLNALNNFAHMGRIMRNVGFFISLSFHFFFKTINELSVGQKLKWNFHERFCLDVLPLPTALLTWREVLALLVVFIDITIFWYLDPRTGCSITK